MLLQCAICQTRQEWKLIPAELTAIKDLGAALIPCAACQKKTYHVYPSTGEYRPGMDRRHFGGLNFPAAEAPSRPVPAALRPVPAPAAQAAVKTAPADGSVEHQESRGPRRVRLELPLRVRSLEFGFEEVTTTVNVSRGGVYFLTERPYRIGQRTRVQLNYNSASADNIEQQAEVARVQVIPGSFRKGVALKYV